jgi:hypothetical protein
MNLATTSRRATTHTDLVSCDHRDPLPTRRLTTRATRIQHRPIPRYAHLGDLSVTAKHPRGGLADRAYTIQPCLTISLPDHDHMRALHRHLRQLTRVQAALSQLDNPSANRCA